MTKKKKIIISSIIVGIILIGVILTVCIANIKRFSLKYNDEFDYNRHTKMQVITLDSAYTPSGTYYNNGVRVIKNNDTSKYGLFSYYENKVIAETKYNTISLVDQNLKSKKSYFRLTDNTTPNKITIVDEHGGLLDIVNYNSEKDLMTAEIKAKTIDLKGKNNKVKTKITNKYHNETIEIKDIEHVTTHFEKDKYFYETWKITTTDNLTYSNLYRVDGNSHTLIQTLNNELGVSLESQNLTLEFLVDGTPVFIDVRTINFQTTTQALQYEVYDINFNLLGRSELSAKQFDSVISSFRVGNHLLFQSAYPANANKYDFYITNNSGETTYYTLKTYKLSLKDGNLNEVKFDYFISNSNEEFNNETVLISAMKIVDKTLGDPTNLLLNERLQVKKLTYDFDKITRINNDRYITSSVDSASGKDTNFNLIDKNYKLITSLENFDNIFVTNDTIIASADDSTMAYICNLDGMVIKKANKTSISDLHDEQYYLIQKTETTGDITTKNYYLEQLGLTQDEPIVTVKTEGTNTTYTYRKQPVDNVLLINEEEVTLIITSKVRETGGYTYTVSTIDGETLGEFTGDVLNPAYSVAHYDDSHVLLIIDGKTIALDR